MKKCSFCNEYFNTGFTLKSGEICIQCATIEGKMPSDQISLLENWNEKFKAQGATVVPAKTLASTLFKSMIWTLIFPVLSIIIVGILSIWLDNRVLSVIWAVLIPFLFVAVIFLTVNWLSNLNDCLVALNKSKIRLNIILSYIINLYALILSIMTISELRALKDKNVVFGRLSV